MIQVSQLEKIYDTHLKALRGLNLEILPKQTLAIVGESGCGKSTLARLLLGLEKPSAGEIKLNGKPLSTFSQKEIAQNIQMIFQDPSSSLNPRKKVKDIIAEPLKVLGKYSDPEVQQKVMRALEQVGLRPEMAERYPHMFSGGQKQRIGIARAMITEPEMIICDEPVSALDVSVQAQVLNLLVDLQKNKGLTYLFISHDLSVVRFIAHKVAVMYLGQVVELADRQDIFERPRHPYTQLLLQSTPIIGKTPKETRLGASELPSPRNPPAGCAFHPRCVYAQDRCKTEAPELRSLSGSDRCWSACHFAETIPIN